MNYKHAATGILVVTWIFAVVTVASRIPSQPLSQILIDVGMLVVGTAIALMYIIKVVYAPEKPPSPPMPRRNWFIVVFSIVLLVAIAAVWSVYIPTLRTAFIPLYVGCAYMLYRLVTKDFPPAMPVAPIEAPVQPISEPAVLSDAARRLNDDLDKHLKQ